MSKDKRTESWDTANETENDGEEENQCPGSQVKTAFQGEWSETLH